MSLYLIFANADRPFDKPLAWGVACLRILGRDLRGSMCKFRKLADWAYIASCSRFSVWFSVFRSRIRLAARSYLVKASMSRFLTLAASAILL